MTKAPGIPPRQARLRDRVNHTAWGRWATRHRRHTPTLRQLHQKLRGQPQRPPPQRMPGQLPRARHPPTVGRSRRAQRLPLPPKQRPLHPRHKPGQKILRPGILPWKPPSQCQWQDPSREISTVEPQPTAPILVKPKTATLTRAPRRRRRLRGQHLNHKTGDRGRLLPTLRLPLPGHPTPTGLYQKARTSS